MFGDRETIIDGDDGDDLHIINFPSTESLNQELISVELDDTNTNKPNLCCSSEIIFWKYARCILYLNLWLSPHRLFIYTLIGLVHFLCCDFEKVKYCAMEILKSALVFFSALAAIYVTQNLVEISNCIGEVFFEFLVGGLTLQISLGLGDAFIHSLFGCSTIDCNAHKIVKSIVEPIVFIGGLFSIFTFLKSAKSTKEAQYAKYSGMGNLIGSTIVIVLAIYFCFHIEEDANKDTEREAVQQAEQHARNVEFYESLNNMTKHTNEMKKIHNDFYFCFHIEEAANKDAEREAVRHARNVEFHVSISNTTKQTYEMINVPFEMISVHDEMINEHDEWKKADEVIKAHDETIKEDNDFITTANLLESTNYGNYGDSIVQLYDKKNAILAMNVMARIFAEAIAKCVEHKFINRRIAAQAFIT